MNRVEIPQDDVDRVFGLADLGAIKQYQILDVFVGEYEAKNPGWKVLGLVTQKTPSKTTFILEVAASPTPDASASPRAGSIVDDINRIRTGGHGVPSAKSARKGHSATTVGTLLAVWWAMVAGVAVILGFTGYWPGFIIGPLLGIYARYLWHGGKFYFFLF